MRKESNPSEEHVVMTLPLQSDPRGEVDSVNVMLDLFSRMGNELGSTLNWEQNLKALCRLVVPSLADICLINSIDENGRLNEPYIYASSGLTSLTALYFQSEMPKKVIQTGECELRSSLSESDFQQLLTDQQCKIAQHLGSCICVPLSAGSKVMGTLTVYRKKSAVAIRRHDLNIVSAIGDSKSQGTS